ncbi:hypothetical protein R3P38DRAFT_2689033 [Favolaschia claudopus]|uniref:DUF6533 domain-containing protein n=1 Tax=Favolaschia claudopus TaxID=2862362 RepID=A0AAW0D6A8_9AGAR
MQPHPPPDPITPDVIQFAEDLLAFKWYFAGIFSILIFDFFLTLVDEVELIWKGKKGTVFYLFVMNRYCPLAFGIVTFFAYFSPLWSYEVCNRFAIVEWLQTLLIVVPAEVVLSLRVYAFSNKNRYLFAFLMSLILAECIIVFYAMSLPGTNDALELPHIPLDSFRVCILYSDPKMDTAYLSTSIAFDCIVLALTLFFTASSISGSSTTNALVSTIRRDGTLYFCVILSGNVVWMALAINARPGLKFMNAQPSMYLTSIMITRLTLSVRRTGVKAQEQETAIEWPTQVFSRVSRRSAPPVGTHNEIVIPTFA